MLSFSSGLWFLTSLLLQAPSATAAPRVDFIEVQGVRLQYLDWGGRGEPLVLVPARCDSPFVYGDLAPLLVNQFRVIGLWARGCAGSGPASDGYDIDAQIRELIGFLDALNVDRATFAGHSASGGKVVRLARQFPSRVTRIVTFDIIYRAVPEQFESQFQAAIATPETGTASLSLESHRREFQAWELGAWSEWLERDFLERTERQADGSLRYRPEPPGWQTAFVDDVKAGRYHETDTAHPALFIVAQDLDIERVKRLPAPARVTLQPLAEAIAKARREQLAAYQENGANVRIAPIANASHYAFVDRSRDVAALMIRFLEETSR